MNYFSLFFVSLSLAYVAFSGPVRKIRTDFAYVLEDSAKRYYLSKNWSNFFQAYRVCRSHDMQLLTINSTDEQTAVESIIKAAELTTNVWTSGTRLSGDRHFFWMSTGRVVSYSNWEPGQPDNFRNKEHCLEIRPARGYRWNDIDCNLKYAFICEEVPDDILDSKHHLK